MKNIRVVVCIVIGVLVGGLVKYLAYDRGYDKGYCRGYNEALDTCVAILNEPVKDSNMVVKVLIEDSTVTNVVYLKKKRSDR